MCSKSRLIKELALVVAFLFRILSEIILCSLLCELTVTNMF